MQISQFNTLENSIATISEYIETLDCIEIDDEIADLHYDRFKDSIEILKEKLSIDDEQDVVEDEHNKEDDEAEGDY